VGTRWNAFADAGGQQARATPSCHAFRRASRLHGGACNLDEVKARALEFTILTAARTSEALKVTWDEIDLDAKVWTIPAERMKGNKLHRVPLSEEN
jgi:integrase-like protein